MENSGLKNPSASLEKLGIENYNTAFWNLTRDELIEQALNRNQAVLSDKGALCIKTGEFTGRSPKDRFIVEDNVSRDTVDWGSVNIAFPEDKFILLRDKICKYFEGKDVFIKDASACSLPNYQLKIRLVAEYAWSALFVSNMFLRHNENELKQFSPDWTILCAPGFKSEPLIDGTRQSNFAIISFSHKCIIIGGTGYTGEIKKGIFSVLNYLLPQTRDTLAMHCSANVGRDGDTAVFFGLSGTGKTTLSADPNRLLIGDDEHGWSEEGVFNFEGGCYAKCIDLSEEKEPDIYHAIRRGAILENIVFQNGTNIPDYSDDSITQNTRVSYPIHHIENAISPSVGGHPSNIFFLTCDAFGVLPPISRLSPGQAMYHFVSGYTAKIAGTEEGIVDPEATFSACFGAPFLPLHPTKYAKMLGDQMRKYDSKVWLINTGWTGGQFGVGKRISLRFTRAMISAALKNQLDNVEFTTHPIFGLQMPVECAGVPSELLDPRNTWKNKEAYDRLALKLADLFIANFKQFESKASAEIIAAAPSGTGVSV